MRESISEKINRYYDIISEGRIEEIVKDVIDIEENEDYSPEDKLRIQILKGSVLVSTGNFEKALELGDRVFQESIKLKKPLLSVEAIYIKWGSLIELSRPQESWEDLQYCEKILNSSLDEPEIEIEIGKGILNFINGWFSYLAGSIDVTLEQALKSLEIFEKYSPRKDIIPYVLTLIGYAYALKGELETALKYLTDCLKVSKGNYRIINTNRGMVYNKIGQIYSEKGDLNSAIEYFKKALEIWLQYDSLIYVNNIYYNLIRAYVRKNSPKQAKEYLEQYKLYLQRFQQEKNKDSEVFRGYKLSEAFILKSSTRTRDRAEAEKILKDIIDFPGATTSLCELYIEELRFTGDLSILDDIQPLIKKLLKLSEDWNSFYLLAFTNLLQGKISLLQMNIGDARRHLTHAQRIAEDHGLQLLASNISKEHDKLLDQIGRLQNVNKPDVQFTDRLNLASLDGFFDYMEGRRALDPLKSVNEEPILLLIMGRDGILYFNHPFVDNWDFDDIFSSFMSAFNSFSGEIFSESIDRIKIGENVILIKPVESFLICYVIKGQSYSALQKLSRFSDAIKWKTEIWDTLNKSIKTSEMLELNNPPSLGEIVNEIFNQ